jgi:hypothetical protein
MSEVHLILTITAIIDILLIYGFIKLYNGYVRNKKSYDPYFK